MTWLRCISTSARVFPLGKTGGLIEARQARTHRRRRSPAFPLGKTGGLIEAPSDPFVPATPLARFRWVKPAASLKRGNSGYSYVPLPCFRWVKPAASLKRHRANQYPRLEHRGFRWVKPAASLKPPNYLNIVQKYTVSFRWVKPAASLKHCVSARNGGCFCAVSAG